MCRGGVCASTRCPRDRLCTEGAIQILCGHMHIPARRCACTHTYIHRTPTGGALHGRRHLGPWQARARTCTQKCARTHTHTRHPQKALHRRRPPGPQQARAHTCTHTNVHTHTTLTGGSAWKVPSGPLGGARAHTRTHTRHPQEALHGRRPPGPQQARARTCTLKRAHTHTRCPQEALHGRRRPGPQRARAHTCTQTHAHSGHPGAVYSPRVCTHTFPPLAASPRPLSLCAFALPSAVPTPEASASRAAAS